MRMEWLEITLSILLEMVAVDHNRRRGFAFPSVFFLRLLVRIGIPYNEHETLCIGRPGKIGHAAFDVGQDLSFATRAIEQPHLSALFLFRLISARREECEVLVI